MGYIVGANRNQITLLPDSLDDYVDPDNTVRVIDAYVDSLDLESLGFTKSEPSSTGRPPYSPHDLLKLYIYGYINRIRSSRRLETETKRNLEVIWLINKLSPDHKTIARFRHENSVALKNVFRDFVKLCIRLNLYGKELVAIDGSKFKAVNSKDRNLNDKKLKERIARLNAKIDEYTRGMDDADNDESASECENPKGAVRTVITNLKSRKQTYQTYMNELEAAGETQKSLTDSDSRLMMANGKMDVCYNVQSAVDSKNKLIVDFGVTNSAQDNTQLPVMALASAEMLEVQNLTVVADKGYDGASDAARCIEQGIKPHVAGADYDICLPVEERTGVQAAVEEITGHHNGRCVYLPECNIAICPMGKFLYPSGYKNNHSAALFRNGRACSACPCKCTTERYKQFEIRMPKTEFRKTYYGDKDLRVKQIRVSADKEIVRQRKSIVEHPFGSIKRAMDSGYLLTKRIQNVTGELSLTFLAYNLKRAINIIGTNRMIEAVLVKKA